jgi:hypothetical protein
METAVIFNTKADARRVSRRLRDFGVLSFTCGREVRIQVSKNGAERDRELAIEISRGER